MKLSKRCTKLNRISFILVVIVAMHACANINHLREAQDTFNKTAALENQLTPNAIEKASGTMSGAEAETQIRAGYSSVLVSLDNAESDNAEVLKANRLYGNLLMLRALTYWRLQETDKAAMVATSAGRLPDDQLLPRDKALAIALPGLIRNSQAYAILEQELPSPPNISKAELKKLKQSTLQEVNQLLAAAQQKFEEARATLADNHGLQVYLLEAKLAADKNLIDAHQKFTSGKTFSTATMQSIRTDRDEYKIAMCQVAEVATGDPLPAADFSRFINWNINLGLKPSSGFC